MFVKSFVMSFGGARRTQRTQAVARRLAQWPARVHFLVAPSPERAPAACAADRRQAERIRVSALGRLRRAAKTTARAALRAAYAGSPLTPTGYLVLGLIVSAIAMVAMLSASSAGNELEGALPLHAWFA
ncbi:hypothetical protein FAZ69_28350 [Trinickia terrae]|uniref:Uncharacterized protein n=1 Tax=Trinickia terrae TaxID=2571161 RepID=A0A4U1HJ88_9BURK|nr:hypothetical protein [Trinickia terrae]TKC81249.1 hypothetical protein FAZ69_28350 [Trinickia terrae]